jgi:hypothetical protein
MLPQEEIQKAIDAIEEAERTTGNSNESKLSNRTYAKRQHAEEVRELLNYFTSKTSQTRSSIFISATKLGITSKSLKNKIEDGWVFLEIYDKSFDWSSLKDQIKIRVKGEGVYLEWRQKNAGITNNLLAAIEEESSILNEVDPLDVTDVVIETEDLKSPAGNNTQEIISQEEIVTFTWKTSLANYAKESKMGDNPIKFNDLTLSDDDRSYIIQTIRDHSDTLVLVKISDSGFEVWNHPPLAKAIQEESKQQQ